MRLLGDSERRLELIAPGCHRDHGGEARILQHDRIFQPFDRPK
jgi:hypothetical protein